ncbi:ABC transporter permease [Roseateles sp. BYS180W]|uniref:ABC transporter permease n=1 Tax=Roseateles rivi TaxID=3299028 RepID=A0ABW7FX11_9BURK
MRAKLWRRWTGLGFGVQLLLVLLVLNASLNPARFAPAAWGTLLGMAAPLVCAAMAATPVILSGRGGIDIATGALMGAINAVVVMGCFGAWGLSSPWVVIPVAVLGGAAVGALSGWFAVVVRVQPIVATLGSSLILGGLTLAAVPEPGGQIAPWLQQWSGVGSLLPLLMLGGCWALLRWLPYHQLLMATGSDDRAAFTAGVPVSWVRWWAYVIGGAFAGVAALSLTALISSADPGIAPNYTMFAISAAALGGVSLAGGRGGMRQAAVGALDIFLLQTALTYFNASTFTLQMAYGSLLLVAVCTSAWQHRRKLQLRQEVAL